MKQILALAALGSVLLSGQAFAKDVVVSSYCPMAHVTGIGHGTTYEVARDKAIKACLAKGGMAQCCNQFIRRVSG